MVPRKKKYESGEASNFMTRKRVLKKLQLTLKDFRRLCILKGVFPREPRNRKRAQKGNVSKVQTLYYEKDIRFLLHEPVVWKFREFKVFLRKLKKAQEKKNYDTVERLRQNKPKYSLDHIVRERYPTFIDAIRDLEDCLCLCFLYSTFPKTQKTPVEMTSLCRRLTTEFMHYVIEAKALRKVFCSIKGYYFQAEIKGQTVTWVIPHNFGFVQPAEVDMRLMSIFVEFYTCVLGFVNYRLFHSLNITYPPKIATVTEAGEADMEDRVGALNQSLQRTVVEDEDNDVIDNIAVADEEKMKEAVKEREMKEQQSNLFKGLKFFLGREVPREPLVFMIRAVGGEVSWDSSVGVGATFNQSDSTITHQVMDRDAKTAGDLVLGRFYIQPQWIFDSINRREKCREKDYALGETLPPHLSPFVSERERRVGDYVPPEQKALEDGKVPDEQEDEDGEESEEDAEDEEDEDSGNVDDSEEEETAEKSKGMGVQVGMMEKLDDDHEKKMEVDEEYKLRVMMIKKKHRNLYRSMMKNRRKRMNESKLKEKKRKEWDEENTPKSKKKKTHTVSA